MDNETNSRVMKLRRREQVANETGKCSYCRPHKGENTNRHSRHDKKGWKDNRAATYHD